MTEARHADDTLARASSARPATRSSTLRSTGIGAVRTAAGIAESAFFRPQSSDP